MVRLSPPPDFALSPLAALLGFVRDDQPPPVDQWHPQTCGTIDIRIAADGTWFHEGSPIRRAALVRLFSRILRREADGSHVLVTPAEKLTIIVEDAAFVAIELREERVDGEPALLFRLNTGDIVMAGGDHPLVLRDGPAGLLPYLHVRGSADRRLEARLARPVYYALADLADAQGAVTSCGTQFSLGTVEGCET